ncbi:MAG: PAS domain S-box protein [Balneolia bacterium]|nr:PAS domain S-box protein [Balneolia bacterium]
MKLDQIPYIILVIEDNPGDYVLIEDYLLEHIASPEILHATSFCEARELLKENADRIQTIFLDLTLPDKSGEDLITEVVRLARKQPVIVLTGYTDASFAIKSLTLGASDYLLKDEMNAITLYKSLIYNIERKRSVMKLQESEQRYSDLFHLSPQPMWVFDTESLRILDVNQAAEKHYGYSAAEFYELTIEDIRPKESIAELHRIIEHNRANNIDFSKSVSKHIKKSGEVITVEVLTNKIVFKGRPARIVLANDITEKIEYIKAIEEQNKKLREIAWVQSHVVRAPLARIMGLVGLIQDEVMTEEEQNEILQYILTSAGEMDNIVKDIIDKTKEIDFEKERGSGINSPESAIEVK